MDDEILIIGAATLFALGYLIVYGLGYTHGVKSAEKQFCDKYLYDKKEGTNG